MSSGTCKIEIVINRIGSCNEDLPAKNCWLFDNPQNIMNPSEIASIILTMRRFRNTTRKRSWLVPSKPNNTPTMFLSSPYGLKVGRVNQKLNANAIPIQPTVKIERYSPGCDFRRFNRCHGFRRSATSEIAFQLGSDNRIRSISGVVRINRIDHVQSFAGVRYMRRRLD